MGLKSFLSLFAVVLTGTVFAGQIAHYRFGDGNLTDDETGSYSLQHVQSGGQTASVTLGSGGVASFPGGNGDLAYLEATGPGGSPEFTVSFWFRAADTSPASPRGLFSNNNAESEPFSWDILLADTGVRAVGLEGMNLTAPSGAVPPNTWHHVLLRKRDVNGETVAELRVTPASASEPAAAVIQNLNPGGLQMFRLGINRASDAPAAMDLFDVRVYDDAAVDPDDLFAAKPDSPAVISFEVDDLYVNTGDTATFSWQVRNADAIHLSPEPGGVTAQTVDGAGQNQFSPSQGGVYTLRAERAGYPDATATVEITVGPPRPNLLVFLVDDMGTQDTSEPFHYENGEPVVTDLNQRYRTPNMETLSDQGRKFLRAYAAPVCTPSRVSLMTGMNTVRHHVTNYTFVTNQDTDQNSTTSHNSPSDWRQEGLDETDITLPELLRDAGYRTILAGKAHFGPRPLYASDPTNFGFDVNIGGSEIGRPKSYLGDYGQGTDRPVPHLEEYHHTGTHLTEALTLEMKKAITESVEDGSPFFAYMTHYAVHSPFEVDPRFAANYPDLSGEPLAFATLIEGMDKSLGDLLTHLESLGVAEDTLVVFFSDNGSDAPIGLDNTPPLRGRKGNRWEGGIRIPIIAAWAEVDAGNAFQSGLTIPTDTATDAPVAIFDWFPTLLHVAGVPFGHEVDGMDLRPILTGGDGNPDREILIHFPHDHRNDYFTVLRAGDWKLHYLYAENRFELYRLDQDGDESADASGAEPTRLMRLARRMARLLEAGEAQWPTFSSGGDDPFAMPDLPAVDADGDGLPDLDEDVNRNGLQDAGETEPDDEDTDGDNTDDRTEQRLGLDPLDPVSAFLLEWSTEIVGRIEWPSLPGTEFRVESRQYPADWTTVQDQIPADSVGDRSGLDVNMEADSKWFRILLTN